MTTEIKAIETKYNGYRFRSRLEARWAVFFDALEEPWEYEKEGFDLGEAGYYLPDFWLPRVNAWVEVKGGALSGDSMRKIKTFAKQCESPLIILAGQIGTHRCAIPDSKVWKLGPIVSHLIKDNPGYADALVRCPSCWDRDVTAHGANFLPTGEHCGDCQSLDMTCTNGHEWLVQLAVRANRVEIIYVGINVKWLDLARLLAGSRERYDAAVEAARSARFEHGESGAQVRS